MWVLDLAQRTWSRLTTDGISNRPVWTPDGRRLVYSSNDDLWWIAADGSGRPESLLVANGNRFAGSVSPDGRAVVFQESSSDRSGIRSLVFDSAPASRQVLPGGFGESAPALSPDGKWLAYMSNESGQPEVYVRPFPDVGSAKWQVSLSGGFTPVWAHNGRELFYLDATRSMVAVTVQPGPTFTVVGQRVLFPATAYSFAGGYPTYDVTPDDKRFVMIRSVAPSAETEMVLVQHWAEDLKRRAQ